MAAFATSDLRTRRSIPGADGNAWSQATTVSQPNSNSGGWHNAGTNFGSADGATANRSIGADAWNKGNNGNHNLDEEKRFPPELYGTFVLLFVTALCLHADQNLAAPNLSAIAEDFQMTPLQKDTRLGGMVQFGFFLIGGAVSLLVGPATDQVDRVSLLSAVVCSACVPSLMMSLWVPSTKAGFFYFFLARICTGIAIGGSFPVLFSLVADIFPASQRGFVSACISAATNVGAAVGGMMSGIVGPRWGWRVPFGIVAIPALVCAVLVRLLLTDPRTERNKKRAMDNGIQNPAFSAWMGTEEVSSAGGYVRMEELDFMKFKRILHVRTNMLIFAQALPGCIPISCICTFLADYLAVEQGMTVQASTAVTAVFGVSCLCFAVTGGIFGAQLYTSRKGQLALLMGCASCFAALPFMLLVNSSRSAVTSSSGRPTAWAFFLALIGGCAAVTGPNVRAILMNINDSEVRGTVFSAFTLFDDLGKGLGPSIISAFTSLLGRRVSYTLAFSLWWLSGAILICLRDSLQRDGARGGGSLLPFKSK